MKRRIFRNASILVVLSVLVTFIVIDLFMYNKTYEEMKVSVRTECGYIKLAVDQFGEDYLTQDVYNVSPSRITVIGEDGTVLRESAEPAGQLENHSDRPEVAEALKTGIGSDTRYSQTLDEQTYYYAVRLEDGNILRVARTTDTVLKSMESGLLLMLLLIVLIGVLAVVLAGKTAKRLVRPLNEMNLEYPLENVAYEELSPLLVRIDQQNKKIQEQVRQLKQSQEEYLAITEYMKDGLIVTNRNAVLSINRAAQNLFGVTQEECVNHDIITVSRNEEMKKALQSALAGNYEERLLELNGRIYQLLANPVRVSQREISGAVILILDITEKQKAETMRREFSANVSHELKTPLMSISGYAEIIENGMVRPQDISNFAGRIHSEASRLTSLVEDIIKLSRLDEADGSLPVEEVELHALAKEVENRLTMRAKKTDITLSVLGEPITIRGVRQVLYEMIYNLCDNAIKYNNSGGYVKIWTKIRPDGWAEVAVEDNGIGIEKEHQERIFERFYRVDKSHSRETGGTGLGLSIVKHGALLHDAKLQLESEYGKGTVVRLIFHRK